MSRGALEIPTLWLDPIARSGPANMAWDQTLLDLAEAEGRFFVRVYRWDPYCLSFGRHEPAQRRYDRTAIEAAAMHAVRRPTGGRAVWHARELTYAVAAPAAALGSLPEAYRAIHEVLARAVSRLGATPTLASAPRRSAPVDAGACFASPAGGELVVDGAKVLGSAQVRQGTALLQHGSMLLEDDQSVVTMVTLGDPPADGGVPLARLLRRQVTFEEAAVAVRDAVMAAWPADWNETSAAMPEAVSDAAVLAANLARHEARFGDPAWTWYR